jgi:putative endonuclease
MSTTLERGQQSETLACAYLQQQGLQLLERNWRCRLGEIDLVMQHDGCIVFVEVRYRRNTNFYSGAESVDPRKQQKLISAASLYLQHHHRLARKPARFDVVSMSGEKENPAIDWIRDAFQAA